MVDGFEICYNIAMFKRPKFEQPEPVEPEEKEKIPPPFFNKDRIFAVDKDSRDTYHAIPIELIDAENQPLFEYDPKSRFGAVWLPYSLNSNKPYSEYWLINSDRRNEIVDLNGHPVDPFTIYKATGKTAQELPDLLNPVKEWVIATLQRNEEFKKQSEQAA
jgi:hypothetical protein